MRTLLALASAVALLVGGLALPATGAQAQAAAPSTAVPPDQRAEVLGANWQQSTDRAFTTSGDADGLHLLVASGSDGYQWRTVATLAEPGVEADSWIGNACVTGSGRRAVVVYAPRTFTNDDQLFARGAFTAVVDLLDGEVRKLPVRASLAYFDPSCGAGESALLTQAGNDDLGRTRLLELDATTGRTDTAIEVPGQLTSAVPTKDGIVAADSGALVRVDNNGTRHVLAGTTGVPFRLAADADGGVTYLESTTKDKVTVRRFAQRHVTTLGTGALADVNVTAPRGGRVFVTGALANAAPSGSADVTNADVPAGSELSMQGDLALTSVQPGPQVQIRAKATRTGKSVQFALTPSSIADGQGNSLSPALSLPGDPSDAAQRYCSVPRDDPTDQAMQPRPRQVEWAVDQAVRNVLTVQRPANWKNLGMPAYTPQGLFPAVSLAGGGYIPAQVMLGVAAQESNLWEAARFAVPGVTANPLIGNYYGVDIYNGDPGDDWDIHWDQADCGYGVTQVTDGMRLAGHEKPGETALPYQTQRAVALDFAANIAAGVSTLAQKWNQTRAAGLTLNNGDPSKIENWFFAVWAYNSGLHAKSGSQPWGVGWANNPVNPNYPANREPFLDQDSGDAAHPQDWSYPEKVMGFAAHPVAVLDAPDTEIAGYRAAWWNGGDDDGEVNRYHVEPPYDLFCDASDNCERGAHHVPSAPDVIGEPAGPCAHQNAAGQYDLECWYHQHVTWKSDCDETCGNELLRFDPGYAYQDDGRAYPPLCDLGGLPANAVVVDDVPDGTPSVRPGCPRNWSNAGTFSLAFKADPNGTYPGKIDTHQLGVGLGGHIWFTHTRSADDTDGRLEVDGSWQLNAKRTGPMKVYVAMPDIGGQTADAAYTVDAANGPRTRTLHQPQGSDKWVSLGTFMFDNVPKVTLTNVTPNGDGTQDIAFDAVAFQPVDGQYHEETVEADALFDENQNIDTTAPESWLGGPLANRQSLYDWATGKATAIRKLPDCQSSISGDCVPAHVRQAVNDWLSQVTAAGVDPVNHPAGNSLADWIGFANPATDRPPTDRRPDNFDNDSGFKIRLKATVSFVTGTDGKIVAGSEFATYEHRTADTHLPGFVLDLLHAVQQDYHIALPDLRYRLADLNHHDGEWTSVDPLGNGGVLPGRAYATAGKAPVAVDSVGSPSTTNAVCVAALANAGGTIGYRPMLSDDGPTQAMSDWVNTVKNTKNVAGPVDDLATDVQGMFFDSGRIPGVTASLFVAAPPIWQELDFKACADGSIQQLGDVPVLRSSWMPDEYLYHNLWAINLSGDYSGDSSPVYTGRFDMFSKNDITGDNSAYGSCDSYTGRSGSPWTVEPTDTAGLDPTSAHFCVDSRVAPDAQFSG